MNLLQLVGNTRLQDLSHILPLEKQKSIKLYAKLEGDNLSSSVKDRAAKEMIMGAIERGELKAGMALIEATSGNTGIALAIIAKSLNIEITLVMPLSSTKERVQTMQALGAKIVLIDGSMEDCRDWAEEQVRIHKDNVSGNNNNKYLMLNQFANEDNPNAHYKTTGPEIWRDTDGKVTHFVSAMGTTGTIVGVSRYLKEKNNKVIVVGCQPTEGSKIPGIRRWSKEYLPKIFKPHAVDRTIDISQANAEKMCRNLALNGLFTGVSAAGAAWAALQICNEIDSGVVVFISCDRGDRYLSSDIFNDEGNIKTIRLPSSSSKL